MTLRLYAMNLPRYKAGPVEYWIAEAGTQFINGALAGIKLGGLIGGGTGVTANLSSISADLSAFKQILLSVSGFLVTMAANGIAQVSTWHQNGHPFPNPWPVPTGTTTPPFQSSGKA